MTLVDVLEESFGRYSRRTACVCMGEQLTFADIDRLSQDLGAWLQQRKLAPGARVALMMPNVPQYSVAIAAVLRAGFAVVNVNPLYTPRELEHQLNDSGAEAIIVLENFAHTLEAVVERTAIRHVVAGSDGRSAGILEGQVRQFCGAPLEEGSSGVPVADRRVALCHALRRRL